MLCYKLSVYLKTKNVQVKAGYLKTLFSKINARKSLETQTVSCQANSKEA